MARTSVRFPARAVAIAVVATFGMAGCGTSSGAPTSAPPSPATLARSDAVALLAAARLPDDAQPSNTAVGAGSEIGATSMVDLHRTFLVDTMPSGRWLTPRGAQLEQTGTSNIGLSDDTVSFPATAVLPTRWLVYSFWARARGGWTLRVDAQVVWIPRKPAAARVAPGAAEVDVSKVGVGRIVRVTSAATIATLTAIANSLRSEPLGVTAHCPAETGGTALSLSFRHAVPAAHPYAIVLLDASGCADGTVTQLDADGQTTSSVTGLGAAGLAERAATAVGLTLGPA